MGRNVLCSGLVGRIFVIFPIYKQLRLFYCFFFRKKGFLYLSLELCCRMALLLTVGVPIDCKSLNTLSRTASSRQLLKGTSLFFSCSRWRWSCDSFWRCLTSVRVVILYIFSHFDFPFARRKLDAGASSALCFVSFFLRDAWCDATWNSSYGEVQSKWLHTFPANDLPKAKKISGCVIEFTLESIREERRKISRNQLQLFHFSCCVHQFL